LITGAYLMRCAAIPLLLVMTATLLAQQSDNPQAKKSESAAAAKAVATTPKRGQSETLDPISVRYKADLDAANKQYAQASAAARAENEKKLVDAKDAFNTAAKAASSDYIKSLEAERETKLKADDQTAAKELQQKIDLERNGPQLSEVQKLWAESYAAEAKGDHEAGIAAVRKVIEITGLSDNTFVNLRLGWLNYLLGDYEEALTFYKAAASSAPLAITPLQGRLNCFLELERSDDAIETARAILKLDPMNFRANRTLGDVYYAKQDYSRAGGYYERLVIGYPDNMEIASSLGWCHLNLGQPALAKQIFGNVLAVAPATITATIGYTAAALKTDQIASGASDELKDKIVIQNLPTSNRPVSFTLNDQYPVTLQPGFTQVLGIDRAWTVRFKANDMSPDTRQELKAGQYDFSVDGESWKLSRQ
jgi:tetratricopeptide (TPR) repeat protein